MSDGDEGRYPRWRVLVDGLLVAVDDDGTAARLTAEKVRGAFPLAPDLLLDVDGPLALELREGSTAIGGHRWAELDDVTGPGTLVAAIAEGVRAYDGSGPRPPRRPDWFRVGWRDEVHAWLDDVLPSMGRRRTGPISGAKVWSLSAVLEVPTDGGPLFLKAACEWFRTEPRLTATLGELWPASVPTLVAIDADRGWQLMEPLSGLSDEDDPDPGLAAPTASLMAELQLASVDHRQDLLSAGLQDRGLAAALEGLREIVAGSPELRLLTDPERAALPTLLPRLERRFAEIAAWGLPETLVHGDLHLGNVADPGPDEGLGLTIYDWTDACLAHPLVDLATLVGSSPGAERDALVAAYSRAWHDRVELPSADVLVAAAHDVERVHQAVTYELLQASLEEASRWEMEGVVARCLRLLLESNGG